MCSTCTPRRRIPGTGLLRRDPEPADRRGPRVDGAEPDSRSARLRVRRNGTANVFIVVDAHRPWRRVKVTERATSDDFAQCMPRTRRRALPEADRIRVVLDNLSTHSPAALYPAFPAEEARRLLGRLEFHYTPKHASWLNMVEIEIGVLKRQCLNRRIDNQLHLAAEIAAWQNQRNEHGARIKWMFSTQQARAKMAYAYPTPTFNES